MNWKEIVPKTRRADRPLITMGPQAIRLNMYIMENYQGKRCKIFLSGEKLAFIVNSKNDGYAVSKQKSAGVISAFNINKKINYEKLKTRGYHATEEEINGEKALVIELEYQDE